MNRYIRRYLKIEKTHKKYIVINKKEK